MISLPTLHAIVRQAGVTLDDIEEYLTAPTGAVCPYCGREHLRRWEQLNGRCEFCRLRYVERAWSDERCRCALPRGWSCRSGIHSDESSRPVLKPGTRGPVLDHCPAWRIWWQATELPRMRERRASNSRGRDRGGIASDL